jgi:hypothetical protein
VLQFWFSLARCVRGAASLNRALTDPKKSLNHPRMADDSQFLEIQKSCEGPVLNSRGCRKHRSCYLNELVIDEIRDKAAANLHNFLFSCCTIEFVQLW